MNTFQLKQFIQSNNPHLFGMVWNFADANIVPFSNRFQGDFRVVHPDETPELLTRDIVREAAGYFFWIDTPEDVTNLAVLSDTSLGFDRSKVVVGTADPSLLAKTSFAGKGVPLALFRQAMIDASAQ